MNKINYKNTKGPKEDKVMDSIRELKIKKEDFFKILKDILEWYEKHSEVLSDLEKNDIKLKKLFLESHPEKIKIVLLKLDVTTYFVILQMKTISGEISTSWIHEDEVYKERIFLKNNPDHICHKVISLSDLYEISEPIIDEFWNKNLKLTA